MDALIAATREMVRVLKPSGSIWVNLGDKYAGADVQPAQSSSTTLGGGKHAGVSNLGTQRRVNTSSIRPKSLIGIPWRYAIRCIDDLGLILRAEVIWSKCLSGGTHVYARVDGREKVIMVKDLARCAAGTVELWTGTKWSAMHRCDPTPPTEGRAASSAAARQARYRGKPIPPLVADLEIEFRNGERVGCTPNHKWPTHRGIVRADELAVGDVVPTVRLAPGSAQPGGLDDEMTGWLVGLYIAEGSRSEDMVQIASHTRETERFDRLRDIADAFDGRFALHHTKGNSATATLSGKVIRAILDTYVGGRTAQDKRLAPACWRRSDAFLAAVLDGYLSGDGHYDKKADRWVLGFCANDGLATDLRAVAARLGYSLRLRRTVHKFDGRDFPGWGGTLYNDPSRRKRPDSEVVAIRQSRARQFWNIEIADDPHEFALASGILTENSNGLPESVTDRVRRSHEHWFHFTREPRYFSAVDEVREEHAGEFLSSGVRNPRHRYADGKMPSHSAGILGPSSPERKDGGTLVGAARNPLGKLPGSVWTIPTEPLRVPDHLGIDHFAAFPTEFPRRIIQGWSPRGVCVECGFLLGSTYDNGMHGVRDRVRAGSAQGSPQAFLRQGVRESPHGTQSGHDEGLDADEQGVRGDACAGSPNGGQDGLRQAAPPSGCGSAGPRPAAVGSRAPHQRREGRQQAGEPGTAGEGDPRQDVRGDAAIPDCVPVLRSRSSVTGECPYCGSTKTRPSVICDPFGGTGTTALVADVLGRDAISVDLSQDYCRLAEWRTTDPGQRAKAARVEPPPPVLDGQLSLFGDPA